MKDGHVGIPQGEFVEEYCTKPEFDQDGVQVSAGIGVDGKEYGDPVPMQPPVGYQSPPDILTLIRSMVRNEEFLAKLKSEDMETFEESDDFEIDDDPFPMTDYEKVFYPPAEKNGDGSPQGAAPLPSVVNGEKPVDKSAEAAVASPPPVNGKDQHSKST